MYPGLAHAELDSLLKSIKQGLKRPQMPNLRRSGVECGRYGPPRLFTGRETQPVQQVFNSGKGEQVHKAADPGR